ncbi:hypothetical protein SAY86_005954 [Trapa natans]|uniref:X8 domain-containing protein n=1 Tax=Trapa natans TaxID=22666 RepID=A0AAN7QVI5_TRANT|nr:hypothetical protein SAY86_005954 [Trapa natans]
MLFVGSSLRLTFPFAIQKISGGTSTSAYKQKTWCVAKPSSDQATLLANINYACSQVDCKIIQRGRPCFEPDNLMNHASIAMNLYYHSKGRNHWNCDFRASGLTVMTDPSKTHNLAFKLYFYFLLLLKLEVLLEDEVISFINLGGAIRPNARFSRNCITSYDL